MSVATKEQPMSATKTNSSPESYGIVKAPKDSKFLKVRYSMKVS
jgi:hypothetical protein